MIERLGLEPGWHCLEVGAGAGSIAGWLADAGAEVLATDIDTRFLETRPGLEVRRHDILGEPLPLRPLRSRPRAAAGRAPRGPCARPDGPRAAARRLARPRRDPAATWSRLTLEALRDKLTVPAVDIEHALTRFDDPEATIVSGAVIAAWGRAPGQG